MTWIRRASRTTMLAALLAGGACAKGQEPPPAQPAPGTAAAQPAAARPTTAAQPAAAQPATAPMVGSAAADVTVRDADGEAVSLASAWQSGPAVLVFYRGHW